MFKSTSEISRCYQRIYNDTYWNAQHRFRSKTRNYIILVLLSKKKKNIWDLSVSEITDDNTKNIYHWKKHIRKQIFVFSNIRVYRNSFETLIFRDLKTSFKWVLTTDLLIDVRFIFIYFFFSVTKNFQIIFYDNIFISSHILPSSIFLFLI